MGTRIKTIHGVPIPPWKKKPGRARAITMDFVLTGVIPSKKNRQIATINRNKILGQLKRIQQERPITLADVFAVLKANKPYVRQSKKFKEWEAGAKEKILQQAQIWQQRLLKRGWDAVFPIPSSSVKIRHYWKDWKKRDNTGKQETIHDIFVSLGIIVDDDWVGLSPNNADANCFDKEILDHITVIQVTAYGLAKK